MEMNCFIFVFKIRSLMVKYVKEQEIEVIFVSHALMMGWFSSKALFQFYQTSHLHRRQYLCFI